MISQATTTAESRSLSWPRLDEVTTMEGEGVAGGRESGGEQMAVQGRSITWEHDLERALQHARVQQRHVLLDFSAAPM